MVPVLFLFLMTAFAETLELVWKQMDIPILSVMMAANKNLANGKIFSHIRGSAMSLITLKTC